MASVQLTDPLCMSVAGSLTVSVLRLPGVCLPHQVKCKRSKGAVWVSGVRPAWYMIRFHFLLMRLPLGQSVSCVEDAGKRSSSTNQEDVAGRGSTSPARPSWFRSGRDTPGPVVLMVRGDVKVVTLRLICSRRRPFDRPGNCRPPHHTADNGGGGNFQFGHVWTL